MKSSGVLKYRVLNVALHTAVILGTTLVIVAIGGAIVLVSAWALFRDFPRTPSQIPFDSAAWKDPGPDSDQLRYRMHEDLLDRYELVGMAQDELLELLGEHYKSGLWSADGAYNMGIEPGLIRIDNIWLLLWVDDEGRVLRYRVDTD